MRNKEYRLDRDWKWVEALDRCKTSLARQVLLNDFERHSVGELHSDRKRRIAMKKIVARRILLGHSKHELGREMK